MHSTDMSGNTAILRITTGQSVWVATYYRNDTELFKTDSYRYTYFCCVLFIVGCFAFALTILKIKISHILQPQPKLFNNEKNILLKII